MKTTKHIILTFLVLLAAVSAGAQVNELVIKDVSGMRGKIISVPVYMNNTQEATAVQFDLTLPAYADVRFDSTRVAPSRRADHVISGQYVSGKKYRFMLYSPTNKPLSGYTGKLCDVVFVVPNTLTDGETYDLTLSNVVISDVSGDDILTGTTSGTLSLVSHPDFEVSSLTVTGSSIAPGGTLTMNWKVQNIGETPSTGGWKENFYLVDESGKEVFISSNSFENSGLALGASVSRSITLALPSVPGISGQVKGKVSIKGNADSGERTESEWNNSATTATGITLSKTLALTLPTTVIAENSGHNLRCQLTRSGNRTTDETFSLSTSHPLRLTLPETVTISAGQSGVFFYISVNDDDVYNNGDTLFTVTATGEGYAPAAAEMRIEDNEYPALSLTASESEVTEGTSFSLTVSLPSPAKSDVTVNLTAEHPARFTLPSSVVIAKGATSKTIEVTVNDNDKAEMQLSTAFYATAAKYAKAEAVVLVNDNDMPELELTLSPTAVSESAGPGAVMARLVRKTLADRAVTIMLSDDSNGDIYYSTRRIDMAAGMTTAEFSLGTVDNATVEGERTVTITAGVYSSSCNCSATGTVSGAATATLRILDDDGPALTVKCSSSSLLEGKEDAAVLTITRNTSTAGTTTVTVSSDRDDDLTYQHTVTIPDGAESVSVPVSVKSNDVSGDERTVSFTVSSQGYTDGTCWALITDQSLPDAVISSLTLASEEVEAAGYADADITVANNGNAPLPAQTRINIYMDGNLLGRLYTQQPIGAGDETTMSGHFLMPDKAGRYTIQAVVNEDRAVTELVYLNNTSAAASIALLPPFSATVTTDKDIYTMGEKVIISGTATGAAVANKKVEIYVMHNNVRDTLLATTDALGQFTATYDPKGVAGNFGIGACYPGENLTAVQDAFDIYGMQRTTNAIMKYEPTVGHDYAASVSISNTGSLPLHNVTIETLSAGSAIVLTPTPVSVIGGGERATLPFTLRAIEASTGDQWQNLDVRFTSDEGVSFNATIYYYSRMATGKLRASITAVKTTMVKGASRDYSFQITNTGQGETGTITLSLPEGQTWMTAATSRTMPSLATNDTATIVLRLTPADDMALNMPVSGTIGINCENGEGLPMPFTIEPVSESTGTLVVDVCDEYTYYTDEAPHVKGADVTVSHPTTGATLYSGATGDDGLFTVDGLAEGYYTLSVKADGHDSYRGTILVDPGAVTKKLINLTCQAITVDWSVKETEVQDEYKIVTTVKYETSVPAPVVTISGPTDWSSINDLKAGESQIFYYTFTNEGLITAQQFGVSFPGSDGEPDDEGYYTFGEFLIRPLSNAPSSVAPGQSWQMPLHVICGTELPPSQRTTPCNGAVGDNFSWPCGNSMHASGVCVTIQTRPCQTAEIIINGRNISGGSGGPGSYTYVPPSNYGGEYTYVPPSINIDADCNEALEKVVAAFKDCAVGLLQNGFAKVGESMGVGTPMSVVFDNVNAVNALLDWARGDLEGEFALAKKTSAVITVLTAICTDASILAPEISPICGAVGAGNAIASCMIASLEAQGAQAAASAKMMGGMMRANAASLPSYMQEYYDRLRLAQMAIENGNKIMVEFFGGEQWLDCQPSELQALLSEIVTDEGEKPLTVEALQHVKPAAISQADFERFIQRYNNSLAMNGDENSTNFTNVDAYALKMAVASNEAITLGFESLPQMMEYANAQFLEYAQEHSNGVCASITLQIDQTMTMTRQAFRGTLTVGNGSKSGEMKDVLLNLEVKDADGNVATAHEFQMNAESLEGFEGTAELGSKWTLAQGETGTATILFIPTKYAAEQASKVYSFGGTLTYTDPATETTVTRQLLPVTLTVKPSPVLDLTYFMQRDIFGDDPLTKDVVEPMQPAEFAVLIDNRGYGDATNVRMVTDQPRIIENEKGLDIDFEILSSQLNGGDKTLAMGGSVPTDFGTIPARGTSYAQWWLQSTLLGHFTEYDIEATHVTSYGNEDLSLLNNVSIHELIRSVNTTAADGTPLKGWLVNDIADARDLPDMIYLSDGTVESVSEAAPVIKNTGDAEYTLTLTKGGAGWNYANVIDPTWGRQTIATVTRDDGAVIDPHNCWQTDRTLRDGEDPLYEHRIHIADNMLEGRESQTYVITFAPAPEVALTVDSVTGLPQKGEQAQTPVTTMTVHFNKAVKTFTAANIRLEWQGRKVDEQPTVTKVDDKTYTLTYAAATAESGYYVLTVYASAVKDMEGFSGESDKKVSWNQLIGGVCSVNVRVSPEGAGTATPQTGTYAYGESLTLTATATDGYVFKEWLADNETLSADSEYRYAVTGNATLTAVFAPRNCKVTLLCDNAQGSVSGIATGIYDYGTALTLVAEPVADYAFSAWKVNGETAGTDAVMELTITGETTVEAVFEYVPKTLTMEYRLVKGWNWITLNPEDAAMLQTAKLAEMLGGKLVEVRGPSGSAGALNVDTCYQVLMGDDAVLSMATRTDNADQSVTLQPGWNWIPYRPHVSLPVGTALANLLAKEGDIIKGQDGFAVYDGTQWTGTLQEMHPGLGYQLCVRSITSFTYPVTPLTATVTVSTAYSEETNAKANGARPQMTVADRRAFADNMCVVADIVNSDDAVKNAERYTVGAFVGDDCRGVSSLVDGCYFITVYGQQGDNVAYEVYDTQKQQYIEAQGESMFSASAKCSLALPAEILIDEPDAVTVVNEGSGQQHDGAVHDLQGRTVSTSATPSAIRRLKKGIYIHGSRKVLVE